MELRGRRGRCGTERKKGKMWNWEDEGEDVELRGRRGGCGTERTKGKLWN